MLLILVNCVFEHSTNRLVMPKSWFNKPEDEFHQGCRAVAIRSRPLKDLRANEIHPDHPYSDRISKFHLSPLIKCRLGY